MSQLISPGIELSIAQLLFLTDESYGFWRPLDLLLEQIVDASILWNGTFGLIPFHGDLRSFRLTQNLDLSDLLIRVFRHPLQQRSEVPHHSPYPRPIEQCLTIHDKRVHPVRPFH